MRAMNQNRRWLVLTAGSYTVAFALLTLNCLAPNHMPFSLFFAGILILLGTFSRIMHKNSSTTMSDSQSGSMPQKRL